MNEPCPPSLEQLNIEERLHAFSDAEIAASLRAERDALYRANVDAQPQSEHNARSIEIRSETGRKLILIREDNQVNARLFRDLFELVMQCATIATADGNEALHLAYRHAPDLIQSDIMGPNQSGLDFARLLRNDDRTRQIPLVCVSAWGGGSEKVLEPGFDAFMSKPINVKNYLDLIDTFLCNARQSGY